MFLVEERPGVRLDRFRGGGPLLSLASAAKAFSWRLAE